MNTSPLNNQAMTSTHTDSSSTPSPPASPATTMTSAHSDASPTVDNSLDDIFGSSPPHETMPVRTEQIPDSSSTTEPSDLPSLRRQHVTAGYRDGITVSKGERVQDGFDAGFPVGAQLGMRAGTILGILEGITRGYEERSTSVVKKPVRGASSTEPTKTPDTAETRQLKEKILRVYQDALKTLDVQAVFSGFEAPASERVDTESGEIKEAHAGEKPETQLGRKGDSVIGTWEERLAVAAWEKNMEALEMKETDEKQGDKGAAGERS